MIHMWLAEKHVVCLSHAKVQCLRQSEYENWNGSSRITQNSQSKRKWSFCNGYMQWISMILSPGRAWLMCSRWNVVCHFVCNLGSFCESSGWKLQWFYSNNIFHLPVSRCLAPLKRPWSLGLRPLTITAVTDKIRTAKQPRRFFISNTSISSRNASMYWQPTWKLIENNVNENIYAEIQSNVVSRGK